MEEVTPIEDLMREHGVLNRLLLIYEEIVYRLENGIRFFPSILNQNASIIYLFIEHYHEKTEEKYVFPLFLKNNRHQDLIIELYKQHLVGRKMTKEIMRISSKSNLTENDEKKLINLIKKYVKMYRVHESREDTVVFQELRSMLSKKEYDALGEIFEKEEEDMFGKNGYEIVLKKVEGLEKELNIFDISKFTPCLDS
jgi:hemerythrin-like domain-containing protein